MLGYLCNVVVIVTCMLPKIAGPHLKSGWRGRRVIYNPSVHPSAALHMHIILLIILLIEYTSNLQNQIPPLLVRSSPVGQRVPYFTDAISMCRAPERCTEGLYMSQVDSGVQAAVKYGTLWPT